MAVVAASVVGLVLLGFSQISTNANAHVYISNDDFIDNENAVSKDVEISQWSNSLTISLDSDPTTGYKWEVIELEGQKIVEVTDDNYVASETEGTSGKEVWTFHVLKAGTGLISMEYSQPGEGGKNTLRKLDITVAAQ